MVSEPSLSQYGVVRGRTRAKAGGHVTPGHGYEGGEEYLDDPGVKGYHLYRSISCFEPLNLGPKVDFLSPIDELLCRLAERMDSHVSAVEENVAVVVDKGRTTKRVARDGDIEQREGYPRPRIGRNQGSQWLTTEVLMAVTVEETVRLEEQRGKMISRMKRE
ncbi:hypothetical protein LR48_Vigan1082s002300 [Vigna angularis]|uniref:Uncharacterized protein n=1 Tax=Phaseolus angularis TaxID=3914 RepID=A0A0L9TIF2_PHAAN|nr:hypothetical protein LR48_Vigan1082s002300 [Vigna angularis]